MHRLFLFLLFSSFFFSSVTFSEGITSPAFPTYCYTQESVISADSMEIGTSYKLRIPSSDVVVLQGNIRLPYQYLSTSKDTVEVESIISEGVPLDSTSLGDDNERTGVQVEVTGERVIDVQFGKLVSGVMVDFKDITRYYTDSWYILKDGSYVLVDKNQLHTFTFSELQIRLEPRTSWGEVPVEVVYIGTLYFYHPVTTIVTQKVTEESVYVYRDNRCKNVSIPSVNHQTFSIDATTQELSIQFQENTAYDPEISLDSDADGVNDRSDNCKEIANPNQKDTNADGKGDVCSDDDADGFIGEQDNCPYVYNPDQKDINRNGIGDVCEFDSDKDGVFDAIDNCRQTPNSDQRDTDKDGIGNACDNCESYNPTQRDSNANGIGDTCEEQALYLEQNDSDHDGIIDWQDNCSMIANSDQGDGDADGVGDVCDNCSSIQNPGQEDIDGNTIGDMCEDSDHDGVLGYLDNCMVFANADQKDTDNDGVGDMCEDDDRDGKVFSEDNCPYDYNRDQRDTDSDGIGDVCDEEDNRFIESNKIFFITLIVIVVLLFGGVIFYMIRKLGTSNP